MLAPLWTKLLLGALLAGMELKLWNFFSPLSCLWEPGGPSDADRMETKPQEDKGFACHFHCLIPSPWAAPRPQSASYVVKKWENRFHRDYPSDQSKGFHSVCLLRMFPPPVLTCISASSLLSAACLLLSDPLPVLRRLKYGSTRLSCPQGRSLLSFCFLWNLWED